MATTTVTGSPVPTLGDAPNVPADMLKIATFLDPVIIPRFSSTALATVAFPSPFAGQMINVSGQLYIWRNLWFPIKEVKHGRVDRTIEGNGYLRITNTECFFNNNNVAPTSITGIGINNSFVPYWDGTVDGSGALLKVGGKSGVFTTYYTSGDTVAIHYIAVR